MRTKLRKTKSYKDGGSTSARQLHVCKIQLYLLQVHVLPGNIFIEGKACYVQLLHPIFKSSAAAIQHVFVLMGKAGLAFKFVEEKGCVRFL